MSDDIVSRLEDAILSGQLQPGEKITEQVLSEAFGVSRGPLREAIRTLEGRRLLLRTPYSGVRVVDLSSDDLEQILITREALEGMASRQAAENMSLREIRQLRQCAENIERLIDQDGVGAAFRQGTGDNDFHLQIVRGSRNRWLAEILCRDLYSLLRICRLKTALRNDRASEVSAEHMAVVEAIEQRDPDAAERMMRLHVSHARESLLRMARDGK